MSSIIGIILIVVLVFVFVGDKLPTNGVWQNVKEKALTKLIPKSDREIATENVGSAYNLLDRFFSEETPKLLQLPGLTDDDRKAILGASATFYDSKDDVQTLENTKTSIGQALLEKILNTGLDAASPTPLPEGCEVICGE